MLFNGGEAKLIRNGCALVRPMVQAYPTMGSKLASILIALRDKMEHCLVNLVISKKLLLLYIFAKLRSLWEQLERVDVTS